MKEGTIFNIVCIILVITMLGSMLWFGFLVSSFLRYNEQLEQTDSFEECFTFCKEYGNLGMDISEKSCVEDCDYKRILEEEFLQ